MGNIADYIGCIVPTALVLIISAGILILIKANNMAWLRTRECSPDKLHPAARKALKGYLAGEQVLICCETIPTSSVLWSVDHFTVQAVTGQQVVVIHCNRVWGNYKTSLASLPLTDVISFQEDERRAFHVTLRGQGNTGVDCVFASRKASLHFVNVLKEAIARAKAPFVTSTSVSPVSIEDSLKALTRLHETGLINDVEFQQKRKELLRRL